LLVQRSLAWWLSTEPTSDQREQLATCLRSSVSSPTAITDLHIPPNLKKPSFWDVMSNEERQTWLRLAPKTWSQMSEQEHADWKRVLRPRSSTNAQDPVNVVQPVVPAFAPVPTSPTPTSANMEWCGKERDSLLLLQGHVTQSIAQVYALAGRPIPNSTRTGQSNDFVCDSSRFGTGVRVSCSPDSSRYLTPGSAVADTVQEIVTRRNMEARINFLLSEAKAGQDEYDARFQLWQQKCGGK
jgi:hypothetical protein